MSAVMNEPAAAPAAAAPAAPAAQPTAAAPAAPAVAWLPDADPELIGHVQNAAWQGPADAVRSHRELQKLLGADRAGRTVVVPTNDDAKDWGAVFDKLGRPQTPDGYKLAVPEGADPAFSKAAASKFHELGLNSKQAAALADWWNGTAAGITQAEQAAETERLTAEHQALAKDWGTGPEAAARKEIARRAAVQLGLDEASIDALEKVAGYSKTLKALAKMGDLMREHGAAGMEAMGSFGMTPEGARAKRTQLMADAEWRKRAMNPQSQEWAEMQRLDAVIAAAAQ